MKKLENVYIAGMVIDPYEQNGNIVGVCSAAALMDTCPCCGDPWCNFWCDESQAKDSPESEDDAEDRLAKNNALRGIAEVVTRLWISMGKTWGERACGIHELEPPIKRAVDSICGYV